jgi:hypothetical protein
MHILNQILAEFQKTINSSYVTPECFATTYPMPPAQAENSSGREDCYLKNTLVITQK